jgi:hypothetical protein
MSRKITKEEFIIRAKKVHSNKYDYSKVVYNGMHEMVSIICPKHGEFWQTPANHLSGKGCPECGNISRWNTKGRMTTQAFIEKAKKIHGDKYDYSKVEYINSHTKICIICPKHGEFWQTPNNHLTKYGCKKCAMDALASNKPRNVEEFIKIANKLHGNKYDYSKVEYKNCKTKVCIICPKHGEFWQTPDNHINKNHPQNCPFCSESKLEQEIRILLTENNIKFDYNKSKPWLKGQRLDFYLPDYNIGIECQGKQHFEPVDFGSNGYEQSVKDFLKIKKLDLLKKEKCFKNNTKLIYYGKKNNEDEIITNREEILKILDNWD